MDVTSCRLALVEVADKLDPVLSHLGFTFWVNRGGVSSSGVYAAGVYYGGGIKIGLIYRANSGLGVIYENSQSNVSHTELMERLGHANDCKVAYDGGRLYSKDGGDVVDALIYDLQNFALDVLVRDKARFDRIVRDAWEAWLRRTGIRIVPKSRFQVIKDALGEWARRWGLRR